MGVYYAAWRVVFKKKPTSLDDADRRVEVTLLGSTDVSDVVRKAEQELKEDGHNPRSYTVVSTVRVLQQGKP